MNLRLELVTVPVADVDRAKAFYVDQVGFSTEQDVRVDDEHRFVELMPPGSPCSIALPTGYVDSEPGSLQGIQVNVDDVSEVHACSRCSDAPAPLWRRTRPCSAPSTSSNVASRDLGAASGLA